MQMENLSNIIYKLLTTVPAGTVVTYGRLAELAGKPGGARAVGWAMSRCPEGLPWYRVVKSDGSLMPGEGGALQRVLLEEEGVTFNAAGKVDVTYYGWGG